MPLMALAFPILPGKTPEWRAWMDELNGSRREEFLESRRRVGVQERTFLQTTPMGDLVIVTIEGDDPGRAFGQIMSTSDAFGTWFAQRAKDIHGVDLAAMSGPPPTELVVDTTKPVAIPA